MPFVDRGVELNAWIRRGPGRDGDLFPQVARLHGLRDLTVGAPDQIPVPVLEDRAQIVLRHAHRIVGVLARNREVGGAVPVRVVDRKLDLGIPLAGERDDTLHIVLRDHGPAGILDRLLELRVVVGRKPPRTFDGVAGLDDGVQVPVRKVRAGHEGRHLLLLDDLPVDELLDIRMIDIDHHHLGGPPGRATRLDGAGGAVADLEEAHQAGRFPPAREGLVLAPQAGKVRTGARAVFEQPRFTDPQVHDAALVHQVVADSLDKAGVGLGMFVGVVGALRLARLMVDVEMPLRRAVDAIRPMEARVEPLRRVGRAHLPRQHKAHLIVIGLGVGLGIEIAALPTPVGPGSGEAVEELLGAGLARGAVHRRQFGEGVVVGHTAP